MNSIRRKGRLEETRYLCTDRRGLTVMGGWDFGLEAFGECWGGRLLSCGTEYGVWMHSSRDVLGNTHGNSH